MTKIEMVEEEIRECEAIPLQDIMDKFGDLEGENVLEFSDLGQGNFKMAIAASVNDQMEEMIIGMMNKNSEFIYTYVGLEDDVAVPVFMTRTKFIDLTGIQENRLDSYMEVAQMLQDQTDTQDALGVAVVVPNMDELDKMEEELDMDFADCVLRTREMMDSQD